MSRKKAVPAGTKAQQQGKPTGDAAFTNVLQAIQTIEVVSRSLAEQEIEMERTVLEYATKALWCAHDFLCGLKR